MKLDESFNPISDTEEEVEDLIYGAECTQSLLRPRTRTHDLEDRKALDHDEDDGDNINYFYRIPSRVYLVESVSARSD